MMGNAPGRVLAIDYGSKRVGVAVSDPTRLISQGVGTFENDEKLLGRLCDTIRRREVVLVVVGMPYSADGGKGTQAREVGRFIDRLKEVAAVEVDTWDESLSSVRANEAFREAGMKRRKRAQKWRVDEMAARLLLQEYLDRHEH